MNKAELVSRIAEELNVTKKVAEAVIKSITNAIHQALTERGDIRIDGLGTFRVAERKARTGVNPRTGAKMEIPASKVPAFRAAKALKDVVAQ